MTGTLRGFGSTFDLVTGQVCKWYVGKDGVRRWADNDPPVSPVPTPPVASRH